MPRFSHLRFLALASKRNAMPSCQDGGKTLGVKALDFAQPKNWVEALGRRRLGWAAEDATNEV